MAERVLANPLSGQEIRQAILDKLDRQLAKDCNLQDTKAYGSFWGKVSWQIFAEDSGRQIENSGSVESAEGELPDDFDQYLNDGEILIPPSPPNDVRVETGQEVPVLTREQSGRPVIKGVKYSRKGK